MRRRKPQFEQGQTMIIATILFVVVSITVLLSVSGQVFRNQRSIANIIESEQSYFLAESGVEDVIYRLITNTPVASEGQPFLIGSFLATTNTVDGGGAKTITTTANWNDGIRKIRAILIAGTGVTFHYAVQSGSGGFSLGNGAGINGNVYSNGSVNGGNHSFITGDAFAVGSVNGVDVQGETQTGVSPVPLPISDDQITEWKGDAATQVFVGNKNLNGTGNTLGPIKIQGNLTLGNNASLVVNDTIWVTGGISLGNNASIALASSYGTRSGVVIADGAISLGNSGLSGSGDSNSELMLISLSTSGSAISLGNNFGAVVLYAPNGTINIGNNANIAAMTAKTISLGNNVVIDYKQGLIDLVFSSGPSGGWRIQNWQEIP